MKCRICGKPAVIKLRSHNIALCPKHLIEFVQKQTYRAIKRYKMFEKNDHIAVAVSGGKDSLALLDILTDLGYKVSAFYIDLGIKYMDYSKVSKEKATLFCKKKNVDCLVYSLPEMFGMGIDEAARKSWRTPCSLCGMTKRYLMNMAAKDVKADVIATGHNLDDQSAALFANLLRWDIAYLSKGYPVLPEENGFPKKVKPLIFLTEREIAAYAIVKNIDYVRYECPHSEGARFLIYKEYLNAIENISPGTKRRFYQGYTDNVWRFRIESPEYCPEESEQEGVMQPCKICGMPTAAEDGICSFCRFWRPDEVKKLKEGT